MPSPYTFTKNAQGNIETFQNGQRISTGTASSAERYGYVEPTPNAPKVETPQLFSSNKGQTIIENAKAKETKLAGVPAPTPTSTPVAQPTPTTSKVSLVNEAGQTIDFENPDINKSNIESYLKSGYSLKSASGAIPSWLSPTSTGAMVTPPTQTETDLGNAKAERDTLVNNLKNFNVSNDPALQQMLSGISAGWDTRINEMERVNKSRAAAVTQTGVRLGSRYTGGAGGMFGSIISVEEKDATQRISTLEGQKQQALSSAKSAYEDKKWSQYAKMVDIADQRYKEQLAEVETLNKAQVAQDSKIRQNEIQANRDTAISGLLDQGITNPGEIIALLNQGGGDFTAKEIAETIKNLSVEDATKITGKAKDFQSFVDIGLIDSSLSKQDQWKKYVDLTSTDEPLSVAEAAKLGVKYGTTKSQAYGIMPQKDVTDLPTKTITQIDSIRKEFEGNQIVKDFVAVQNKLISFSSIIDSKLGGPGDLALVFEFMKALDPTSVVREQEYDNASKSGNIFAGAYTRFNGYLKPEGGFLPDNVKKSFLEIINQKYNAVERQYDNLYSEKGRLINKKTGETDGVDYLTNFKQVNLKNLDSKTKPTFIVNTSKGSVNLGAFEQ